VSALHPLRQAQDALRQAQDDSGRAVASAGSPWGGTQSSGGSVAAGSDASLTVQRDGKLQRVSVHVDLVTSTQAAVTPNDGSTLSQGDNVVTAFSTVRHAGDKSGGAQGAAASNPLAGGTNAARGSTRGIP
jgi:hypothetical protein